MTFLTIREAADRSGHSKHKIRRLILAIAEKPDHADRSQIEPSPADVERMTAEGVQFTWRVSEELVRRELGDAPSATSAGEKAGTGVGESPATLSLLERAIAAHERASAQLIEQLQVKDAQIASLNERLRESNLLMGSLQKQLPEAKKASSDFVEAGTPAAAKKSGKGTMPAKARRRGWLKALFS